MRLPFLFILLMQVVVSHLSAQRTASQFHSFDGASFSCSSTRDFVDTLMPLSFIPGNEGGLGCFTGYYNSPDSGYISGNNQYGDVEKAQFFSLTQMGYRKGAVIQSVIMRFTYKTIQVAEENIFAKIWSCDSGYIHPKELLAASNPVSIGAVSTDGATTLFTFAEPVTVTDSFFVSVQLPLLNGDTVVLQSTDDDCVATPGYSWEQWNDGTWHAMINSWVLNIDLAVFPVAEVELLSGINEPAKDFSFFLYPSPANDFVRIEMSNHITDSDIRALEIRNAAGLVVKSVNADEKNFRLDHQISTKELPNGLYLLSLLTENGEYAKPLMVFH
ncbi:MAG: T9SS type A sorting domain-containing protein [Bacteroidetes bacterium]|nr:T9SS type A sorting domain-containing protein [Bacteroidota bacterium]